MLEAQGSQGPAVSLQGDIGNPVVAVVVCLGLTLCLFHWNTGIFILNSEL